MSLSKPWKSFERRHAKRLGTSRIWRQDFGEVAPDGETETDIWDCKCYQRFSVVEMFVKRERDYREFGRGRRFHLALFSREHPRAGDFVLIQADYFTELLASHRTEGDV